MNEYIVTIGRIDSPHSFSYRESILVELAYTAADAAEQVRIRNQFDGTFQGIKAVAPLVSYRHLERV